MWGEKVHNGNIDEQIWPRQIAIAEALWTAPANRTITDALKQRIQASICKLVQVGVGSGPIKPSAPCAGVDGARFS